MASNNLSIHIEWMWKSNLNPFSQREKDEWSSYLEEESEKIEEAYQNRQRQVYLKNHYIDFEEGVQVQIKDPSKRRPVTRQVYNKEEWIQRVEKLGAGSFGTVYQGIYRGSHEVAYKVIKKQLSHAAQTEANILKTLRHPNIVQYIDVIHTSRHTLLVMELIDGGTLFHYIGNTPVSPIYWCNMRNKMVDVAYALSYLHEKNVVHADLKSDNILLRKNGSAVLSDFGLSKVVKDSASYYRDSSRGALRWLAPELCESHSTRSSFASDVWAFGCVLMEIITGELPWTDYQRTEDLLNALAEEPNGPIFQKICRKLQAPESFRRLLCACCTWSKHNRPDFEKVIRDLRAISDDDLGASNPRSNSAMVSTARPSGHRASTHSYGQTQHNLYPNEPLYSDHEDSDDQYSGPSYNYGYSARSKSATPHPKARGFNHEFS